MILRAFTLRDGRTRESRTGRPTVRPRGQSIVELALIMPVLLVLLAAGADLARLFHSQVSIESAARAGALEAAANPTSFVAGQPCNATTNRVMCAVITESSGSFLTVSPSDVSLVCVPSPCVEALGNQVTINVVGHFSLMTPILSAFTGGTNLTFTQSASAQIAVHPNIGGATASPSVTATPTASPTPTATASVAPSASATLAPTPTPTPYCDPPTADFTFSPSTGTRNLTVFQFVAAATTTSSCPILAYSWNFGDGAGNSSDTTSTQQNPTNKFQKEGGFTVTLVVSNFGGPATRTRTVTVTR